MSEESFDAKKVGNILEEFYKTESTHLQSLEDFSAILANPNAQQRLSNLLGIEEAREYIQGVNDAVEFSREIQAKYKELFSEAAGYSVDVLRKKIDELSKECSDFNKIKCNIKYCKKFSENKELSDGMSALLKSFASNEPHKEALFPGFTLIVTQRTPRYEMLFKELHKETEYQELSKNGKYLADWYSRILKANRALNGEIKRDDLKKYLADHPGIKVGNVSLKFNHSEFFDSLEKQELGDGLLCERDRKNKNKLMVKLNDYPFVEVSVSDGIESVAKKYKTIEIKFAGTENVTDYGSEVDVDMVHEKMSKFIERFQADFGKLSHGTERKPVYKVVINKGKDKTRRDTTEEAALRKLPQALEGMANESAKKPVSDAVVVDVAVEPALTAVPAEERKIEAAEEGWPAEDSDAADTRTPAELKEFVREGLSSKLKEAIERERLRREKTHIKELEKKLAERKEVELKLEQPTPPAIAPKPVMPKSTRVAEWEARTKAGRDAAKGALPPPIDQTVRDNTGKRPVSSKMEELRRKFENPPPKP